MHAPPQARTRPPTDDRLEHATHQQRSHSPLPLSALLLALASGQVPSGVTLLIVAGLMLRKVHELLEKIEKIQWKLTVTLDPEMAIKEIHHYPTEMRHAPQSGPDEATEERSGVRKRPR